jgi:hypothetical protein
MTATLQPRPHQIKATGAAGRFGPLVARGIQALRSGTLGIVVLVPSRLAASR